MKNIKLIAALTAAALAASALVGCADKNSSSSAAATTTTTTTASAEVTPPSPDGSPRGKYYFTQAFENDKEVFLSVDLDPTKLCFEFKDDGKGIYTNPGGSTDFTWDKSTINISGGAKNDYTLDGDTLTVTEGSHKLIYVREGSFKDPNGIPEGKYAFVSAHNDGTPITADGITAENTYMVFNSDGTGNAFTVNGNQSFNWSKGHITYADKTDSTYVLRGNTLTVFEITSTVIMEKVADKDA